MAGVDPGTSTTAIHVAARRMTPAGPAKKGIKALNPACTTRATLPHWRSTCWPRPAHGPPQNGQ